MCARPVRCSVCRWEVKVSCAVLLLQYFLLIAFFAFLPFSLEGTHSSDVRNIPSRIDMRHVATSRLPSLQFWLVSKIVRVVPAFHRKVPMNSRVTDQLWVILPVTLLLFRLSEALFAFLFSLFVLALTFRRPTRLRPHLHRQSVTDRQS